MAQYSTPFQRFEMKAQYSHSSMQNGSKWLYYHHCSGVVISVMLSYHSWLYCTRSVHDPVWSKNVANIGEISTTDSFWCIMFEVDWWFVVIDTYVGVECGWQWLYHVLEKDDVMLCSIAMLAVISVDSQATSHAIVTTTRVLDVTGWCPAHDAGNL